MTANKKLTGRLKKAHQDHTAHVDALVGKRVAERRIMANLTQTDTGQPLGVTMQQAQRYEAGENSMDVATLVSVARTIGCRPSDFLVDFEGEDPPAALSADAIAVAKVVDTIESGGLRRIVKLMAEKLRAHEREIGKEKP